jgi:hypothetical protein
MTFKVNKDKTVYSTKDSKSASQYRHNKHEIPQQEAEKELKEYLSTKEVK